MKNWIKKSLISVCAVTLLGGALAGCSRGHHSDWSADDGARMRDKVADKLDLTTPQQQKLTVLVDQLLITRNSVRGESADPRSESPYPRSEFSRLISGDTFDRKRAQAMLDEKTRALQAEGPATINALADFYDSLDPQQQDQVRDKLAHRHHWLR
jgi:Spy/CpxP family protein refolding chaperone